MLEGYLMLMFPNFIQDYIDWVKDGCKEVEEEKLVVHIPKEKEVLPGAGMRL